MESGRGSAPGNFRVVKESAGRNVIVGNTVTVPAISQASGARLNTNVNSWDTVIYVHE
jgi:hypothetical protein